MKRALIAALAVAAMTVTSTGIVEAKKPERTVATPAAVCRTLVEFEVEGSFAGCMATLHQKVADFRFPDDTTGLPISLFQRCAQFEAGTVDPEFPPITYPFAFEEGPDWPFPVFTAYNRQQCALTLYAYHTLAEAVFGGGE